MKRTVKLEQNGDYRLLERVLDGFGTVFQRMFTLSAYNSRISL